MQGGGALPAASLGLFASRGRGEAKAFPEMEEHEEEGRMKPTCAGDGGCKSGGAEQGGGRRRRPRYFALLRPSVRLSLSVASFFSRETEGVCAGEADSGQYGAGTL